MMQPVPFRIIGHPGDPPPTVSVLIKSYNHAAYIRRTIDSILTQTFQDFEIVATDDASTAPLGTAQTYVGSVGVHSAVFVLTWQADGNVVGHYYHPDNSGVILNLKGKNTGNGELVLTEYAAEVQSAILTLKKTTSRGLIVWSGKMHNTDQHGSHVLDVTFTRKADA